MHALRLLQTAALAAFALGASAAQAADACPTGATWTRCTATPTRTWWPTRPPIRPS